MNETKKPRVIRRLFGRDAASVPSPAPAAPIAEQPVPPAPPYKFIFAETHEDLEAKMTEAIGRGYEPLGAPIPQAGHAWAQVVWQPFRPLYITAEEVKG